MCIRNNIVSFILHNLTSWKESASVRNCNYIVGYISILAWIYKAYPSESMLTDISEWLYELSCSQFIDWLNFTDITSRIQRGLLKSHEKDLIDSFLDKNYHHHLDDLSTQDRLNVLTWLELTSFST